MLIFLALVLVSVAITGVLAFAFFWPMALVHLRDRHATRLEGFGGGAAFVSPVALRWLLTGGYRELADPSLNGLCTPARLALWAAIFALVGAGILALFG